MQKFLDGNYWGVVGLVLIGGGIMAGAGYFLPEKAVVLGTSLVTYFTALVVSLRIMNQQNRTNIILTLFVVLVMSLWATLFLRGVCHVFSSQPVCSMNRIRAVTFLYFALTILAATVTGFLYRSQQRLGG